MEDLIGAKIIYNSFTDKFFLRLDSPLAICWQVTKKCNLNCKYCISNSGLGKESGVNTSDAIRIIRELGRNHVKRLDFTGGEPLLREDLELLLREARKMKITPIVTTNTLLLDEKKIKFLKKYAAVVQVSIDGRRDSHNAQRQGIVFDRTIKNIKRLVTSGCKVRLNSFIYNSNLKDVDFLLGLSRKLRVYSHLFILFAAQGRGAKYPSEIIPKNKINELKVRLKEYAQKTDFYIRILDYDEHLHSCLLIDNSGDVITQGFFEKDSINMGNILKTPLKEIFKKGKISHINHLNHYVLS